MIPMPIDLALATFESRKAWYKAYRFSPPTVSLVLPFFQKPLTDAYQKKP